MSENIFLSSDGTKEYRVVESASGKVCNCPGFTFRDKCKHIESLTPKTALQKRIVGYKNL